MKLWNVVLVGSVIAVCACKKENKKSALQPEDVQTEQSFTESPENSKSVVPSKEPSAAEILATKKIAALVGSYQHRLESKSSWLMYNFDGSTLEVKHVCLDPNGEALVAVASSAIKVDGDYITILKSSTGLASSLDGKLRCNANITAGKYAYEFLDDYETLQMDYVTASKLFDRQ
jgi:hypothetical protein